MSASQFDDILGEFGDSASTPAKISSVAASDEDFDPYGPSHGGEQSADLLDFSSDSEIKRRDTSNGIDSDFDATTSSYSAVMTTDAPSSGLLFDLDTETGANQPSGQHYEFSEEATTTSRTTNLLEDVDNDGTTGEAAEELNVPAGTSLGEPGDVDFLQADEPHNVRGDLLGGSDEEHGYEPEILNGHPMLVSEPHFVDEEEKYLVQVQDSGEEEVTHEDNEASRTTDAGNRYSDYEPEQTQTAEDQSEFTSRIASESTSAQQKQADIQREAYHEKQSQQLLDDEEEEEGIYENQPSQRRDDVARETDTNRAADLPSTGTAQSMREKFLAAQKETRTAKREITPPIHGAGGEYAEEFVPERGYAKNVAAKFKELETNVKSPPSTPGRRKEFTPPREDERFHLAGVVENNPDFKTDVVHSGDQQEEALPERGTAKNIAERFRQLETESKIPVTSRPKREFTPPPGDAGVYENQPKQFQADYNRPPESGIIENQPLKRDDVIRGDEPPKYEEELPERGAAKNLVNRWKQLESESSKVKSPGSGRPKEFTPPREEPRIAEQRKSPCTPLSPSGNEQLDNGSVHPSDLPGQYQPQNEPSVFESTPQAQRSDVLKEGDNDWTEGMPKKNTAKKMLAKFQNIQAEASKQSPGPVSHKAKDVRNK